MLSGTLHFKHAPCALTKNGSQEKKGEEKKRIRQCAAQQRVHFRVHKSRYARSAPVPFPFRKAINTHELNTRTCAVFFAEKTRCHIGKHVYVWYVVQWKVFSGSHRPKIRNSVRAPDYSPVCASSVPSARSYAYIDGYSNIYPAESAHTRRVTMPIDCGRLVGGKYRFQNRHLTQPHANMYYANNMIQPLKLDSVIFLL